MEYQLLGYALGIQIEIIQPSQFICCDFVERYLLENLRSCDNLCFIMEEDNEFFMLTPWIGIPTVLYAHNIFIFS